MSTDISGTVADRQRSRAGRRAAGPAGGTQIAPPRQRRPALAALALLLIVGGALVAGLLAVRMDSRVPVLVAAQDIEPGAEIAAEDLEVVRVASEGLGLIPEDYTDQVVGAYATTTIRANTLLDENMVSRDNPVPRDRAVVSVPIAGNTAPGRVAPGDLVQVIRTTDAASADDPELLGTGYVLEVSQPSAEDLGGNENAATVSLLVLKTATIAIVNAASAGRAGLAVIESGQEPDVELSGAEE
ncbi:SAF domain-containing protein [Nocardioides antri]|uniref:AFP-like domain-containing protein n=1 Tax=Nocardioides antri TaxID=2607659 RepID=A0A5B1M452_9ACTN|nr:SAF domain-containing protein [Nocardioides antri]KAA1427208.1 hypothetical protein F0U47_06800 [Nocardioides antri]